MVKCQRSTLDPRDCREAKWNFINTISIVDAPESIEPDNMRLILNLLPKRDEGHLCCARMANFRRPSRRHDRL